MRTSLAEYLLDTNHASKLMAGADPLTSRVRSAHDDGNRFGLSITVLGELFFAVFASRRQEENLRRLQALAASLSLWPFDGSAAELFGRIRVEQRTAGRPIPPLDVQIAVVARAHQLVLLAADYHFQLVAGLAVENWLTT